MMEISNNENLLEHKWRTDTTQPVGTQLLAAGDLSDRRGAAATGRAVQPSRLLPLRHQRYRRAGTL